MALPDVGVRLSAEGEAQVEAAFKRMYAQAQIAARKSGQSWDGFNTVLSKTQTLLAGLSTAASVGAMVAFVRAGADAADTLQENADAAATTTARYSALAAVFQLNGGNADTARDALGRLSNAVQDLRDGSPEAEKKFRALGLTAKDFEGKDAAQGLELVARAVIAIPDPVARGAAAIDVLGKSGARAIPALRKLAAEGLDGAADSARKLGILLDDETVDAAARVSDELVVLKQQSDALAISLAAGLSPAFHDVFTLISDGAGQAAEEVKTSGEVSGWALRGLLAILLNIGDGILVFAQQVVGAVMTLIGGTIGTIVLISRGQFDKIPGLWDRLLDQMEQRHEQFVQRTQRRMNIALGKSFGDVSPGRETSAPPRPPAGAGEDKAAFARRLAAQRAFLEAEKQMLDLELRAQGDRERNRFEEGLTGLEAYYAERRRILEEALEGELAALEGRRAIEAQNPDRAAGAAAVSALDAQIALRRRQAEIDQAALAREELEARRRLQAEILGFEGKLNEVQGNRHASELARIEQEALAFQTALAQEGRLSEPDQARRVSQFRQALEAGAEFDRQIESFQSELNTLAAARAAIERDVAAARLSEIEGARQILALESGRIPVLREIAARAAEAARGTSDPARVQQAAELGASIEELGVRITEVQFRLKNLGSEIGDILGSSLTEALGADGQAFENFGQRALAVLESVIAGVRRLAAELLANQIVQAFLGLVSGGVPKTSIAANPGVPLPEHAGGGLIEGPGTGTSDSVLMWGSRGEFMIREKVVSKPLALPLLHALNAGRIEPATLLRGLGRLRGFRDGGLVAESLASLDLSAALAPVTLRAQALRLPRLAEGGLVAAGTAEAKLGGKLSIDLGEGLVPRALTTREGTRAVLEVLSRNPDAARAALGLRRS